MSPVRLAVVGDPVSHSLSPRLFAFWGRERGRDLVYEALAVPAPGFREALTRARSEGVWSGWNVTVPHKEAALALADEADPTTDQPRAANVLLFRDGRAVAHNTDAQGFLDALTAFGADPFGGRAVVLGAGGAAAAVVAALRRAGAADVAVFNRDPARAASLARRFGLEHGGLDAAAAAVAAADIVVNATAAGLSGTSPLAGAPTFKTGAAAVDLMYRPRETPFMAQARAAGARPLGGLPMLVRQGALSWKLFFGETLPGPAVAAAQTHLEGLV